MFVSQLMMLIKITRRERTKDNFFHASDILLISKSIAFTFSTNKSRTHISNVEASDLLFYAFSISRMTILTQIHAQTLIQVNEAGKWENKGRKMSSLASSESESMLSLCM